MKRVLSFLLLFIFALNAPLIIFASADNLGEKNYEITKADFTVDAKSAILMEANTGEILFAQNETTEAAPASVTKIMTLILVMEAIDAGKLSLADMICVSSNAASKGGSQVYLKEGETMSVEDLIKCTVIASANDAAVALAETVAGSEGGAVKMMNQKARDLGMENTNFENTTGLDDTATNHYSSALDIALMSRELIKYDLITKYSSLWQDTIRNGEFTLANTNRLVRYYDGCNGLKTGSTDKAGYCISATAKRDGMQLIAVVMGAKTRDIRNEVARNILDYGFANYELYTKAENEIQNVPVYRGEVDHILLYNEAFCKVINKGDSKKVNEIYEIPDKIYAPIFNGQRVGKIRYEIDGKNLSSAMLFVKSDVKSLDIRSIFSRIIKTVLTGAC